MTVRSLTLLMALLPAALPAQAPPPDPRPGARATLSPEGQAIVRRRLLPDPDAHALAERRGALRTALDEAMAAPVIDVARIEELMREQERVLSEARVTANDRLLATLRELPPADRRAYLDGLRASRPAPTPR